MINTRELDANLLEAEFYENKDFQFSYSSLNTLLTTPKAFYNDYVLKQKQWEFKKYLLEGTVIHYLVLENHGFDDKFLVASDNLPSDKTIALVESIFNTHYALKDDDTLKLIDFSPEILNYLIDINLHQSLKDTKDGKGDDKRIAKVVDYKSEEYFSFLKKKGNKTIIDSALLDRCTKRAEIVKSNAQMRMLLGMDEVNDGRTFGIYNELPLEMPKAITGLPFGFKGILDNLVVDVAKKLIRVNDFKTTGKSLVDFKKSVEFWNYWLQAAMYYTLVKHFLKNIIDETWTIEFRFIVFDKYDQMYAFEVTPATLDEWLVDFAHVQKQALYHYENKDFQLPYEFALGMVKL